MDPSSTYTVLRCTTDIKAYLIDNLNSIEYSKLRLSWDVRKRV